VLTGFGKRIAVEISISTRAEHEAGNLTKCLAAGFDYVVLVSPNETVLDLARLEMAGTNPERVRILRPGMVASLLAEIAGAPPPAKARETGTRASAAVVEPSAGNGALLTTKAAAAYVGLAVQTLAEMRVSGESPPFHKIGRRVLYDRADLDAWLAQRKRRSTSDTGR
jgi:excisionase family DNA binding protein